MLSRSRQVALLIVICDFDMDKKGRMAHERLS